MSSPRTGLTETAAVREPLSQHPRSGSMARRTNNRRERYRGTAAEREERIEQIQREIQAGSYEDEEKLRAAMDQMIDRLLDRVQR